MYIENHAQRLVAIAAQAIQTVKGNNQAHVDIWRNVIDSINYELPRGSGFDCGSEIDVDQSNSSRIVINTQFHHMNECGMYGGWTQHSVILTPSFDGFNIRVTGRNRNEIKDYIAECFHSVLSEYFITRAERDESGNLTMDIRRAAFDYSFTKES